MNTQTTTLNVLSLLLIGITSACADVDPSGSDSQGTSVTLDGSTGNPTDGSSAEEDTTPSDDEGSADSGDGGTPPITCNPADSHEPNNVEDEAKKVPNITDDDSAGGLIESILAGQDDVDWFAYMGSDVAFAYVDPAGGLDADMELQLCLFVSCLNGPSPSLDCPGAIYDESPDLLLPGCCNVGGSTFVSIDLDCIGDDDSAYVFMRVDQGHDDICVPYEITYHF